MGRTSSASNNGLIAFTYCFCCKPHHHIWRTVCRNNFSIVSDAERPSGDRFIRCTTSDGVVVNISADRLNEKMGDGDAKAHWGLEHIGITVDDLDAEIERLKGLDAALLEGPTDVPNGPRIAFIQGPDDVRIELLQLRD